MQDATYKTVVNELLVDIFNDIQKIEYRSIEAYAGSQLTMCEMHIIEAIGESPSEQMSDIAKKLRITLPTLTVSVDRLEEKGYIQRRRSAADRRRVEVTLTEKGLQAYEYHEIFHINMINKLFEEFKIDKMPVLMESLAMLRDFFRGEMDPRVDAPSA